MSACGETPSQQPTRVPSTQIDGFKPSAGPVSFSIFRVEGGFGYDILREGKRVIHQPHIPSVPGKTPFADSLSAARVAQVVVQKIDNGLWPPALSQEELQSLLTL